MGTSTFACAARTALCVRQTGARSSHSATPTVTSAGSLRAPLPVSNPSALRLSSFDSARGLRGTGPISGRYLEAQTPVGPHLVVILPPRVEDLASVLDA